MKVRDAMTHPVVTVTTGIAFRRIVELMCENSVSGVPVVDGSGQVLGVVTEGDLIVKEHRPNHVKVRTPFGSSDDQHERRRRVDGLVAGELMTSPAVTVDADADLRVAARLMTMYAIGRLPVMRDGKIVGIVSRSDVLNVFLRPDDEIRSQILEDVVAHRVLEDVPDLAVVVESGVVTLRGVVPRRSTARLIVFHVDRLDGVTKVVDKLAYRLDDLCSPVRPDPPAVGPLERIL